MKTLVQFSFFYVNAKIIRARMNRISLIPIKFKVANNPATTEIVSKLHLATVAKLLSELEHEFSKAIVAVFSDLCKK